MARIHQQGFEARGLDLLVAWSIGGAPAYVRIAGPGWLGLGYQLELNGGGVGDSATAFYLFPSHAQVAEVYIRVMLAIDNKTPTTASSIQIRADTDANIFRFVPGTGDIHVLGVLQGNIGVRTTSYERWEFYIKLDDVDGEVTIRIDGTQVFTFSGDTKPAGATSVQYFFFHASEQLSRTIDVDDIAINDTVDDGRGNDTWPGAGKIYGFRSNIQGPFRAWDKFPDTGEENWEDVDDGVPDDDSTYVQSGSLGQRDAHGTENIPAGSFNIRPGCVQWAVDAKLVGVGSGEIASYIVKDGVPKEGNSRVPDSSYSDTYYLYDMLPTDPDGNEWLVDDFNNTQFGYKAT